MILADFLISSPASLICLPILAVSVSAKAGATIMNRCGQADICYRGDSPNMMVMIMSLMRLKFLMKGCSSIISDWHIKRRAFSIQVLCICSLDLNN